MFSTFVDTYPNDPLIADWSEVKNYSFDPENEWVRKINSALDYFVNMGKTEFIVRPFPVIEGADFIVSMRGTTGVAESLRVIQLLDEMGEL